MNDADFDLLAQQIDQANQVTELRELLAKAWQENRELQAELERLALDNHILREELERERAPKRDER